MEQSQSGCYIHTMHSKYLYPLLLLVCLSLLCSCRSEESLAIKPDSGDTLAVDTSAGDTLASDTVDTVPGEDQKMTPALQYLLSHSGEDDVLPVVVLLHASPLSNSQQTNSLQGNINPYTKADIEAFMAEEKIRSELIQKEYQDMWRQVGERHGLSVASLDSSDLGFPSNKFQLKPAMIHALAEDSLVVLLDVQGEDPQPI